MQCGARSPGRSPLPMRPRPPTRNECRAKKTIPALRALRILLRTSPRHDKSSGTCWVRLRAVEVHAGLPAASAPTGVVCRPPDSLVEVRESSTRVLTGCARGGGVDGSQRGPTPVAWTGAAMAASHELHLARPHRPGSCSLHTGDSRSARAGRACYAFRARRLALGKPARAVRADRGCPWPWDR